MSIKLILAPLDGSEQSVNALCTAQVVAKRFGSHIKAVHVQEKPAEPYLFSSMPGSLKRDFNEMAGRASQELVERIKVQFDEFCQRFEITATDGVVDSTDATASLHISQGKASDVLVSEGRIVDVITISRPELRRIAGVSMGERLESILMNSGRPVLVVPPDWVCHRVDHAAFGWNDSAEASRALFMTLPWLSQMKRVSVLASERRQESAARVIEYLELQGCSAELVALQRSGSVGEALLGTCGEIGAEFLVVGGFSHTRQRQRLFGGVTRHLLENTNIITVMVH